MVFNVETPQILVDGLLGLLGLIGWLRLPVLVVGVFSVFIPRVFFTASAAP
jgi:hypothetical protein